MKSKITNTISALVLAGCSLLTVPAANAYEAGDWIVRAGATGVYPTGDGSIKGLKGSKVEADSAWSLGLNGTYMATDNIGIELLAAWPFTHDIECKGSISALGTCAETKHLPPTLTAQYHFDTGPNWHPFIGIGLNYTYFFDEETKGDLKSLGGDLSLDSSWGFALEAGLDYEFSNNWLVGAQVYWIDIDTDATLKIDDLNFKSSGNEVSIDPWVYMISVGYKF
jgi:outer membrane protein